METGSPPLHPKLDIGVGEVVDNVATTRHAEDGGERESFEVPKPNEPIRYPGYSIPHSDKPIDVIFLFVHGASFSSKLFDSNLKEYLASLSDVNYDWFWELELNYHIEMIDWKSCLSPYQFKSISRCMPVETMYDSDDEYVDSEHPDEEFIDPAAAAAAGAHPLLEEPTSGTFASFSKLFKWNSQEITTTTSVDLQVTGGSETAGAAAPAAPPPPDEENGAAETKKFKTTDSGVRSTVRKRGRRASEIKGEPENVREFKELQKRHGLRVYFSNTVVDVMFYLTCRYGGYMTTQVGRMLNQRVQDLRQSPCGRFKNSEIVLVGHSLGSVILYELLTGHPLRAKLFDEVDNDNESLFLDQTLPAKEDTLGAELEFEVKHVFFWGSPLSSFLVLKNDKSLVPDGPLVTKNPNMRLYNIYHRSDPIATRIEPIFYRDKDYIPPAIRLPSYNPGDVLRRGLELVTKNSVRAAATMFVNKLFSNKELPEGTDEWVARLAGKRRYDLPDPLSRDKRFGILTTENFYEIPSEDDVDEIGSERQRHQRSSSLTVFSMSGKATGEEEEEAGGGSVDVQIPQRRRRRHRPWTIRQLALNCTHKLRARGARLINERLQIVQADRRESICVKLFTALDAEFDSFLNSICSVGINKVDPINYNSEEWLNEDATLDTILQSWQSLARKRDIQLTMNQLKREIAKALSCENAEIEREGLNHYPLRLDFSITGGIQEMLIAPLGLLQSHMKYWSDRDTCMFMLKMITGFTPQISRNRRDSMLSESYKTRDKMIRVIMRLTK